jgi:ligand-binding sensor domain-containing protein
MTKYNLYLISLLAFITSCNGETKPNLSENNQSIPLQKQGQLEVAAQISEYVVETFQDSKGNLWFGRDGYGACKFDGNSFLHFTKKDGLNSNCVQSILEDKEGNIWIGTRVAEKDNADTYKRFGKGGLNKYNGEKFVYFPEIKGLNNNDVYTIYKDKSNDLWFSTTSHGVSGKFCAID